jgi:CheY-like chemotaxis protein
MTPRRIGGEDVSEQPKVLLVDDDVAFLKATSLVLAQAGYAVVTAQDGRSGLAAAREHKPDVAVVDVIMRRPDEGFALARAIRADPDLADVKMLVLTAVGQHYQMLFEPDEQWLPVAKVLEKPTTGQELVAEISALLSDSSKTEDPT